MNLLTVDQASKYLQIHPVTIYRLAKLGQIPSVKFGGSIRIPKDKLDAYQNEDKKD